MWNKWSVSWVLFTGKKKFPALINVIFINVLQLYNCILLQIVLCWEVGLEFELHGERSISVLHLPNVHNCELFAAVDDGVEVYVNGSVRAKDWEIVFLHVLGFYPTRDNIQVLQLWEDTDTSVREEQLTTSSWRINTYKYGMFISYFASSLKLNSETLGGKKNQLEEKIYVRVCKIVFCICVKSYKKDCWSSGVFWGEGRDAACIKCLFRRFERT